MLENWKKIYFIFSYRHIKMEKHFSDSKGKLGNSFSIPFDTLAVQLGVIDGIALKKT